jgi:putative ABC transport system substrate-binding protein
MVNAAHEREFNAAFATVGQAGAGGLLIGTGPYFLSQRRQLVALAGRYAVPTMYNTRQFSEVGGLISYGPSLTDAYRRATDAIFATGSPSVGALQQSTATLPIVFATAVDPVGAGFVASLARPGGNITGFMLLEYSVGTKWLELLKEVEPRVTRVAVLRDPTVASGSGQFGAIQAVASSFGVELSPVGMRDAREIESALNAFARGTKGGLIVTSSTLATLNRELIVAIASRHRLPAVYSNPLFVTGGGLLSYSPDRTAQFRQAAAYVDRILKGEKPADLPVQAPTKYELLINLKTAKAIGLDIPPQVLARADKVIE